MRCDGKSGAVGAGFDHREAERSPPEQLRETHCFADFEVVSPDVVYESWFS